MNNLPQTQAVVSLEKLLQSGIDASKLDQAYDALKLMGLVLGHITLLEVANDREADEGARVSAARALTSIKEPPEAIAERIRTSSFKDLSVDELKAMLEKLIQGQSVTSLIQGPEDGNIETPK
jgi:hypothetical protein